MAMPEITVTRWYLEMKSPSLLKGVKVDDPDIRIEKADPCPLSLYRKLYREVGSAHGWTDRAGWSDDELLAWLRRDDVEVWIMFDGANAAGYFELQRGKNGDTEIVYFGLRPQWIGRGLGSRMLTRAVEEAWTGDTRRVWLHTCSLDAPSAKPNYLARGFTEFRSEQYQKSVDA